jgi:hypothetical protein
MNNQLPTSEEATRKRKMMRRVMTLWALGGGLIFILFGHRWLVNGLPLHWVGYVFLIVGILAIAGVNVFYGGPLDLRLDRPAPRKQPPQPSPALSIDDSKSSQLKQDLARQEAPQIVSIERFFDGNEDPGSIGCNLTEHPGIDLFRDTLTGLLRRPDVQAVYAQIAELDPGQGSWPFTDTLFIAGTLPVEVLRQLLSSLQPDEVSVCESSQIPAVIRANHDAPVLSVWWD